MRQNSNDFTRVQRMYGEKNNEQKCIKEFPNKWKHQCFRSGKGLGLEAELTSFSF